MCTREREGELPESCAGAPVQASGPPGARACDTTARSSEEILNPSVKGYPLFSLVPLLILPLRIKFTP